MLRALMQLATAHLESFVDELNEVRLLFEVAQDKFVNAAADAW